MYAYAATQAGQQEEYWAGAELNPDTRDFENPKVTKPREIAYWRKHPNLHGWMEQLARKKNLEYNSFNGIELELTWADLDQLEYDVRGGNLPATSGFFFGDGADDYYLSQDIEFIKKARAELFLGLRVFYNSSW